MDEPTRSLDPEAARSLHDFIVEQMKQRDGKTVLLATHDMREAEILADRVAILARGKVRQVGTLDEVRRWGITERQFLLEVDADAGPLGGPFRILSEEIVDGTRRVSVALDEGAKLDDMLRALIGAGVTIGACDRIQPDLEQAFSRILRSEAEPE